MEEVPFTTRLPEPSVPAVEIVRRLAEAGHRALLAGGCVRDLLLGAPPQDYDVATDATPERVCTLFRATRKVGAQFGVVLVRTRRPRVEVATFRTDGRYIDGRRPESVTFGDARGDALRRDFTINGMFLDPIAGTVIDYVVGRHDLARRVVRAIGEPAQRFAEDHLRLLRAVRFAARLGFEIESETATAIRDSAPKLADVAAERVRDELEKMLAHPRRHEAVRLMAELALLPHLWAGGQWTSQRAAAAPSLLERLPSEASFEAAFATLVADRTIKETGRVCRALTFSNEQRAAVLWLVRYQAGLDDARPEALPLANLKRLMASPWFGALRDLAGARRAGMADGAQRLAWLEARLGAIRPETVRPAPFIGGEDLIARGVPAGPVYKEVLEELYTRQLDEQIQGRDDALRALDELLKASDERPRRR